MLAQEISAENDLRVKKLALDTVVGKTNTQPNALASPLNVPAPQPAEAKQQGEEKDGLSPTRYGDWEKNGRCIDF